MKYFISLVLLSSLIFSAGCVVINQNATPTPTPQIVYVTIPAASIQSTDPVSPPQTKVTENWTHIETLQVQAKGPNAPDFKTIPVYSTSLKKDTQYKIQASGTYMYGNTVSWGIADAEWSDREGGNRLPGDSTGIWYKGNTIEPTLDLVINEKDMDWGAFQPTHIYTKYVIGAGIPISFRIIDSNNISEGEGGYSDNSGYLTVEIFEKGEDF